MHEALHCEDDSDRGGNTRHVILDGHPDNLHRVRDTGLVEHINRDPETLAAELGRRIAPQERAEWEKGSIDDWVVEGHRLPQSVAYGDLGRGDPVVIDAAYEHSADPAVETELEKAGVRLGYLLDENLR